MKPFSHSFIQTIFFRSSQIGGIFLLAMILSGPKIRQEFYKMTSDLTKISTRFEFVEWLIRSQYRMIDLVKIDWKPISVFPEEAKKFK